MGRTRLSTGGGVGAYLMITPVHYFIGEFITLCYPLSATSCFIVGYKSS